MKSDVCTERDEQVKRTKKLKIRSIINHCPPSRPDLKQQSNFLPPASHVALCPRSSNLA